LRPLGAVGHGINWLHLKNGIYIRLKTHIIFGQCFNSLKNNNIFIEMIFF